MWNEVALGYRLEIAALKSLLLTFDHLLREDPGRFTRHAKLAPVRDFVKRIILTGDLGASDRYIYDRFVLGLQYDRLCELQRLRQGLSIPTAEFEHVMVASANPPAHTVDALWWVAGIDPFGFRLCADWTDQPFTFVMASGVLKDAQTCCEPVFEVFNCKVEAQRRAYGWTTTADEARLNGEIDGHHREALRRAYYLVETRCPEWVCEQITSFALLNLDQRGEGHVTDALTTRFEWMFNRRLKDPANRQAFDAVIQRHIAGLTPEAISETVSAATTHINPKPWFDVHLAILDELRTTLGAGPGDISGDK